MGYHNEIQKECDKLGISNPMQEEELEVEAVSFEINTQRVRIEGTGMNRAGRLFFQSIFGGINFSPKCVRKIKPYVTEAAEQYFSENWLDAETAGRTMLIAFKQATSFEVHWK